LSAETENQHLKELLKRLQDENVSLKNTAFTFSVPRSGQPSDTSFNGAIPTFAPSPPSVFTPTSHLPSPSSSGTTKAATPQSPSLDTPSSFPGDIDFGSLTPLDHSSMDLLDDSDAIMSYDFGGYGQVLPSKTPYKTIASNPLYMSFADPIISDATTSKSLTQSSGLNGGGTYDPTFGQWTGQTSSHEPGSHAGSLDELFGGHIFAAQSPINFNVLMNSAATSPISSAASAMSPVIHQSIHPPTNGPSSTTSPAFESSDGTLPAHHSPGGSDCPKTRAQMEKRIQAEGSSIFAPPPPLEKESQTQVFRAPAGADGPMIMCKGATFPMTEKSDNNIEVLTAWRNITSHPDFKASVSNSLLVALVPIDLWCPTLKNIDINELCSEFTDKARCDGTRVVLDPQGVNSILEKLTTRLKVGA
jgi:AP-1-like transcription factor